MELIRYIHLNPLRAKLVQDLKGLDKYPWTGHSAILGRGKNSLILNPPNGPNQTEKSLAEKTIEDVLLHFGETKKVARQRYRQFVKKGIDQACPPDSPEAQDGGRGKGDERILGSGDFANEALKKAGEDWEKRIENKMLLAELIQKVASHLGLREESILSGNRRRKISEARSMISYLAINDMPAP